MTRSEEARTPDAAYQLIDRAFAEFKFARHRPKHIQVPIDVLAAKANPSVRVPLSRNLHARALLGEVKAVAIGLEKAQYPVFVFGGGAVPEGAEYFSDPSTAAREVVRRSGAASFTTYAGRGIIQADSPLHFGSYLGRPESEKIFEKADLVVAVGTSLSEVDLWRDKLGQTCQLVRVDIDPEELSDQHNAWIGVLADATAFLEPLADMLKEQKSRAKWVAKEVADTRLRWRAEVDANRPGIVPLCDAMMKVMPDDSMIYSDMTQFAYVAKEVIDMPRPGHWHHPFGFGTLGYALPAAIGGAVARRGLPTVAIAGDYGFHYTMQELGVAVELGLSLPIILWDNGKLKEIEDCMVNAQIAPNAVVARNPDFCKLAEAFGARAVKPSSIPEFQQALLAALEADGPTLIHLTPAVNG